MNLPEVPTTQVVADVTTPAYESVVPVPCVDSEVDDLKFDMIAMANKMFAAGYSLNITLTNPDGLKQLFVFIHRAHGE
jgi:hypothetical protein